MFRCNRGFIVCALALFLAACATADKDDPAGFRPVQRLLDLSGLVWLGDDLFLAVHDAKNPDELDRTRVSLLKLPQSLEGVLWQPLSPEFPGDTSSDLESASAIPGTGQVLLAESGDDAGAFHRIFLAEVADEGITITDALDWTQFADVYNVEAIAVASTSDGHLFLWAERNSGQQETRINWAPLELAPFAIGPRAGSVAFALPADLVDVDGKPLYSRPVVGMDVDGAGRLYAVAAFDPEGSVANPDDGPFRSAVFRIGRVTDAGVVLDSRPDLLATVDGLKVESVAARETETDGGLQLYIGTDDENFSGALRPIPLADAD